ncbi:MAG: sulfatase [Phycisphaerales bacterium]|nr:MAG: sulfatase [Phycisphaerales bacterium]
MNKSTTRMALSLAPAAVLTLATGCTADPEPAPAKQDLMTAPNVILVLVDDLGWADLGCFGSEFYETPNLDALAADGMRFTNAYAACAVCSPTRASIMTGRCPARVGIMDWIRPLHDPSKWTEEGIRSQSEYVGGKDRRLLTPRVPRWMEREEITIAEILKGRGYATGFVGKWHLGPEGWFPEDQGFDFNAGGCALGHPPHYFDPYPPEHQPSTFPNLPPREEGEYLTDRESDEAVGFIRRHADEPFFLYLCHYAVHSPIQAKQDLIDHYEAKPKIEGDGQNYPPYAAMVHSVDDAMGAILKTIEELGIADNTLIIFTGDNGGATHFRATDNRPLRSGKGRPYEGGIREPFIVRWPGRVKPGTVSDVPISTIDLLPTICEAVGAEVPQDRPIDGLNLLPLMQGTGTIQREDLYWHFPHYWAGQFVRPYSIIRSGDWKLIKHYETGKVELYNLGDDIGEKNDLATAMPEKATELAAKLAAWLAGVSEGGAKMPRENPDFQPAAGGG